MRRVQTAEKDRSLVMAVAATTFVVLVRLWFGMHLHFCGTPDSCSYLALAQSLGGHRGFVENFVFDYQVDRLQLPMRGIEYWRPGTSFLLVLARPFGGVTLASSVLLATLAGVLLAMAAWRIGLAYSGSRRIACASYTLALVMPPMWFGSLTPDSVLFYGAFAAWFLVLFRVRSPSWGDDALALVCLAVANLIRNDAVLLLLPTLVVLRLRWRSGERRRCSPAYCALVTAGFLLAMLPAHAIDKAVLGEWFPTGVRKALLMTDLGDMSRFREPLTLARMASRGVGRLMAERLSAIPMLLYRIVFLLIGFGAIFFPALLVRLPSLLMGRGTERREDLPEDARPEVAGSLSFAGTLVVVYSLILPAIGMSSLRSFCALLPMFAVLMVAGLRRAATPEGRPAPPGRRADDEGRAAWIFGAMLLFYGTAGVMEDRRSVRELNAEGIRDARVAAFLGELGARPSAGSVVMTSDPAQFSETTGYGAIPLPENGASAARAAAAYFGATHVLVDANQAPETLNGLRSALDPADVSAVPGTPMLVLTLRPGLRQGH